MLYSVDLGGRRIIKKPTCDTLPTVLSRHSHYCCNVHRSSKAGFSSDVM